MSVPHPADSPRIPRGQRAPGARTRVLVAGALALTLALPLAWPARDPLALLAWLALLAAPTGALAGAALRVPGAILVTAAVGALVWSALPARAPAPFLSTLAAVVGLGALGAAGGIALRARGAGLASAGARVVTLAGALLCAGVVLGIAASLGGLWRGEPWPPEVAARLLDLSPLTLAAESAGVDWMRHSFVYEPAGTASIGPELRTAWGSLAGPVCFVVGCAFALTAHLESRRENGREGQPIDR